MGACSSSWCRKFHIKNPKCAGWNLHLGFGAGHRDRSAADGIAQRMNRSSRRRGNFVDYRYVGNGYHYEADEVRSCIKRGAGESAVMTLEESIAVASTMDRIRSAIRGQSNEIE